MLLTAKFRTLNGVGYSGHINLYAPLARLQKRATRHDLVVAIHTVVRQHPGNRGANPGQDHAEPRAAGLATAAVARYLRERRQSRTAYVTTLELSSFNRPLVTEQVRRNLFDCIRSLHAFIQHQGFVSAVICVESELAEVTARTLNQVMHGSTTKIDILPVTLFAARLTHRPAQHPAAIQEPPLATAYQLEA